jgi:hypothetical protein
LAARNINKEILKMRRRLYFAGTILFLAAISLLISNLTQVGASGNTKKKKKREPATIKIVPVGPSQEESDRVAATITQSPQVQRYLQGKRSRLLSFELIEPDVKDNKITPQRRFNAVFYDYTSNRTIVANGNFNNPSEIVVSESNEQPLPNDEEYEEAVRILKNDAYFGEKLQDRTLEPYRAMPPTAEPTDKNSNVQRTLHVGVMPKGTNNQSLHEVVGVNMISQKVVRYPNGAPPYCTATEGGSCGIPSAGQSTTPRNTAGQYQMTVSQSGTTLWEMLVVRPSVSSGTRASGIEVRDVKYKGKLVLKRGHAPVLNVEYQPLPGQGSCGPYRDWSYQEDMFQTPAGSTDPAPGIRISPTTATTALDTGNDSGNFRGVAIYPYDNGTPTNTEDDETVLITELQAGWYRYIMEWRFGHNGTIRPRYGFGATTNSCVCWRHHHHIYWRFDFDIAGTNNNVYQTEIPKKLADRGGWQQIMTETKRNRNYPTKRSFIIKNASGPEAYALIPNVFDGYRGGIDDPYASGDLWFLRFKSGTTNLQNEYDDGYNSTTAGCTYSGGATSNGSCIHIDGFVNNEDLNGQDLVVWYGAHFIHDDGNNLTSLEGKTINPNRSPEILSGAHVVGPDLRLLSW